MIADICWVSCFYSRSLSRSFIRTHQTTSTTHSFCGQMSVPHILYGSNKNSIMNYKFVLMKNIHLACVHQPQIYNKQCCCCCCVCMHHTGWEYRIHQHAKREIEPQPITRTSIYWYQFISAILAKIYSRSPKRASAAKFRAKEKNTTTNTIQSAHSEKEECERENKMNKERTWTQGRREKKNEKLNILWKLIYALMMIAVFWWHQVLCTIHLLK